MSYPFTQLYDLAPSQKHFHRFHIKKPNSTICYTFGTSPSPITLTYGLYLEPEVIAPDTPNGQYPLSPVSLSNTECFNTPEPSSKTILKSGSQSSLTLKDINEAYQEPSTPSFKLLNSPTFSTQVKPLTGEVNTSELIEILPLSTMESTGQVKGKILVDKIGYYRMFFSNESPNQRCQIDVKISVEAAPKLQTDLQEAEISGWLLKKKKKKMQGWAKRWCNIKLGVLSYSKTENGPSRGSVQLHQSVFSISPKTLSINIDSGNELFRFKYFTREDFDRWIQAIRLNVDNASQQLMEFPSRGSLTNRREDLAVLAIERSLSIRQSVINNGEASNLLAEDNGPEIQSKIQNLQEILTNALNQLNSQGTPTSTPMGQSSSQHSTGSEASKTTNQRSKFISFRTKRDTTTTNAGGGSSSLTGSGSNSSDNLDFIRNNLRNLVRSALVDAKWLDENIQKELDVKRKLELQYLNAVGNMSNPGTSRASSPFLTNSRTSSNNPLPEHIQISTLNAGSSRTNGHRSRRSRFLSTASIDTMGADEEFFDAVDIDQQEKIQSPTDMNYDGDSPTFPEDDDDVADPVIIDENDDDDEDSPNENTSTPSLVLSPKKSQALKPFTRRSALPAPTNVNDVNFLSFLRKNIGKDLSTISIPLSFNEPLSILQKMCEEFEYSEYLDRALNSTTSMDRLLMVTAFAFSAYASSGYRAERKPFNPLLGETYENHRPDKGFKYLSEKVSHNPLIFACHCSSLEPGWEVWGEARPKSKFWGKSMELNSLGTTHVTFKNSLSGQDKPDHFVYNKSVTWMRNIVGGTKYIEQSGEVKITNLITGEFAKIVFKESTLWTSSNQEAKATLHDTKGNVIYKLTGQWNNNLMIEKGKDNLEIIWKAKPLPSNAESMYCFTTFAMELNEITPDIEGKLPITDSRLRPDQRLYEEGKVGLAESEKVRLEEGQRARRREREGKGEIYQPHWFKLKTQIDFEKQNEEAYIYEGGYWEAKDQGNFPNLTQIF